MHLHALICKQHNVVELQLGSYPQSCAGWRQQSLKTGNSYGSIQADARFVSLLSLLVDARQADKKKSVLPHWLDG